MSFISLLGDKYYVAFDHTLTITNQCIFATGGITDDCYQISELCVFTTKTTPLKIELIESSTEPTGIQTTGLTLRERDIANSFTSDCEVNELPEVSSVANRLLSAYISIGKPFIYKPIDPRLRITFSNEYMALYTPETNGGNAPISGYLILTELS